jgi:hypothetical protein
MKKPLKKNAGGEASTEEFIVKKSNGGDVSRETSPKDKAPEVTGMNRVVDFIAQKLNPEWFPTSGRTLLETAQGVKTPITEKNFKPEELDAIRQLIALKGSDKGSITYGDYVALAQKLSKDGPMPMSFTPSLFSMGDPLGNIQTTLGRFSYRTDPKGNLQVVDKYDFNPPMLQDMREARTGDYGAFGPYGMIREYAGEKIPPGTGRDVLINLGRIGQKDRPVAKFAQGSPNPDEVPSVIDEREEIRSESQRMLNRLDASKQPPQRTGFTKGLRASQLKGYGEDQRGIELLKEFADMPRGVLGATPIIPGGEGYRTGQAVGSGVMPAKVAGMAGDAATALAALGGAGVIKPKGGNWLAGLFSAEQALKPLKRTAGARGLPADQVLAEMNATYTPEAMARLSPESLAQVERAYAELKPAAAINKWIDTKLTKYVKNEMATPEDPVRALAERDILHFDTQNQDVPRSLGGYEEARMRLLKLNREGAKYPPEGLGKSNLAKDWETLADLSIQPDDAAVFFPIKSEMERNPWLRKVAPDTPVYGMKLNSDITSGLGFDHLVDELTNAMSPQSNLPDALRVQPKDLEKMTVPQAVERVAKINNWRINNKKALAIEETNKADLYKAYPEQKYRWIQLNKPGQFAAESDAMGHSVRGYEPPEKGGNPFYGLGGWGAIQSGEAKVYSLRDAKGQSHATIEVKHDISTPLDNKAIVAEMERFQPGSSKLQGPEGRIAYDEAMNRVIESRPAMITQIKGEGNKAIKKEFLPFVQDFVRSGNWSEVKDLLNANLFAIDRGSDLAAAMKAENATIPQYVTQEELTELLRKYKAYGYKRGGPVDKTTAFIKAHA